MKLYSKVILIMMMLMASKAFAADVVLSTFEVGDDGLTDVTTDRNGGLFDVEPAVMDNPVKSGINTTDRVFGMTTAKGATWWQNWTYLQLKTPITITAETRYLKMMVYRSINNGNVQFKFNNDQSIAAFKTENTGVWEDMVFDMYPYMGRIINNLYIIHHDWDAGEAPSAKYYYDEIVMSDNPKPRGLETMDVTDFSYSFDSSASLTNDYVQSVTAIHPKTILSVENMTDTWAMKIMRPIDTGFLRSGVEVAFTKPIDLLNNDKRVFKIRVKAESFTDEQLFLLIEGVDYVGYSMKKTFIINQENEWKDIYFSPSSEISYLSKIVFKFGVRRSTTADAWLYSPLGNFYIESIELVK